MVERLTKDLPLDGSEPFLVYFGTNINDLFCGPEYTCNPVDITLWQFFRSQDYQRIVFYEGANRLYWYDEQSRTLCLPDNAPAPQSAASPVVAQTGSRMSCGPLGKRNLITERQTNAPRQPAPAPAARPETTHRAPGRSERPRRAIADMAALEILDYIFRRDRTPVATVLIFPHANDLDRRNLNGEQTFREFQSRMVPWAQIVTTRPNLCVFIFQDHTRQRVLETCQRQELTALSNFLTRQESRTRFVRDVAEPSSSEILRLIHRYRLIRKLQVDWAILPHAANLLARQQLTIKALRARLEHTACLDKETLLEWSRQKFIPAKEHIIQHMGSRTKDIKPEEIKQKLSPVIGQQDNTDMVIREVSSWIGAPSQKRPLTLFMVGTSGVGKTYTVQLLAEALQPYGFDLCEFQMTEFSEAHRVSSLIGSPPGYVGSEDEPKIFQALHQSKRLVILFDEIEKAHSQVIKALMQLIDEGKLTWNRGQGDFRECILCFTSNAQRQEMVDLKQSTLKAGLPIEGPDFQNRIRDILVRSDIVPEFCSRINRFLIYNPLSLESTVEITRQQVNRLAADYQVDVPAVDPEFLAKVAIAGAGRDSGARPIREYVREVMGNQLFALLRDHPHTRRVQITKDAGGNFMVCRADESAPVCLDETERAMVICQTMQRKERILDQGAIKEILSRVYCQEDDIDLLIREVMTWFGQVQKHRPLNLFLAGTSGVGKTYTCKLLAQALESRRFSYVYFPMNEYSQESHVNNLLGSATGFAGSQGTPKIFEALKRSNRLVIVFDEIEKAHPTILQTLMQLLDEGVLSCSHETGDFRECIICFTSNAKMTELVKLKSSWRDSKRDTGDTTFQNAVRDVFTRAGIAPEICGRINRFFVYNPLTPEAVFRIAWAEMEKIAKAYELELVSGEPDLLAKIALESAGSQFGARPITRRIENELGSVLMHFKNRSRDSVKVMYRKMPTGYDIVAADPADTQPDVDTLFEQARSVYEVLMLERSFLDTESINRILASVRCQEDNTRQIIERLEIWYSQKSKDRPLSFFLVGASGVGKTYTAKLLAQAMKPYGYEYTYFAMTEYSQEGAANNLTGSAKGYVGSEEKPKLFVDRDRSSRLIIIFDEIEKAHPTVFKTLMQLLDEGTLSWNRGTGDFRECIILFTSNIQMDHMIGIKKAFQESGRSVWGTEFQESIKHTLIGCGVPPELCGRINRFLVYNPLSPEHTVAIVLLEIQKLCGKQEYTVDWVDPVLLADIAANTAGSSSGARAIQNEVETRLSRPLMIFRRQYARTRNIEIVDTGGAIQVYPASGKTAAANGASMIENALELLRNK